MNPTVHQDALDARTVPWPKAHVSDTINPPEGREGGEKSVPINTGFSKKDLVGSLPCFDIALVLVPSSPYPSG